MQKKSKIILSAIIVVVVIVAIILFSTLHKKAALIKLPVTKVKVSKATYQLMPVTTMAIGTLLSPQSITIKAQTTGIVTKVNFVSGQQVVKNQLLLQLNANTEQANLLKAESAYWQAKRQYERYLELSKANAKIIDQATLDNFKNTFLQAKAGLALAEKQLSYTKILAPIAGTVETTALAVGSYVTDGSSVVSLVSNAGFKVEYNLPEALSAKLKLGQKILITDSAFPKQTWHGVVTYISPNILSSNRSIVLRANIDKLNGLKPGALLQVKQTLQAKYKTLLVPAISLIPTAKGYSVYMIKDGKVVQHSVTAGERYNTLIAITSGLKAGQAIISAGQEKVHPGTKVMVIK